MNQNANYFFVVKIGTLHLESCNNGNLDYLNDNKLNDLKQNIAITFMKSCPHIEKVTAWDGYAHYAVVAEWSTGGGNVDTVSIKKHGYPRETVG